MRSPRELIKPFCIVSFLYVATAACNSQDTDVVSKVTSGATGLAIVKTKKDGTDYFFVDTKSNQRLGDLVKDLGGAKIQNIQASWSPDGRKVAILVSYGTKLNNILVYSLGNDHKMARVQLPNIDPVAIYDKRDPGKHFLRQAEQSSGYSENAINDWMTNDTLRIVRGDAVIDPEHDHTRHFLIVLELKVVGDRAQIENQLLAGVLSTEQAEEFLRSWKH